MKNKKSIVLVVGSSNIDIVVRVGRLPSAGETVLGDERREYWGGKGANQALAAVLAGAEVCFVTMLGNDAGGEAYGRHLVGSGISPCGILRSKASTGTALILVDGQGENQIAVAPGANTLLTPGRMRRKRGLLDIGDVVLAQLEVPLPSVMTVFRKGKKRGACNVLNPAPAVGELPDELLRLTDVLAPNETEAAHLAGLGKTPETDEEFLRTARALRSLGPSRVVITAGAKGAFLLDEEEASWMRPPPKVEAVDTTGAGDAFCGALSVKLAEGAALADAVRFAVGAGACSVRKRGAQGGLPSRRQILKNQRQVRQKQIRVG
ncbi:MAG: ribokinase [Nitrospinae bacterium]|nr:ribokinase [Nitrospinota bacterium]